MNLLEKMAKLFPDKSPEEHKKILEQYREQETKRLQETQDLSPQKYDTGTVRELEDIGIESEGKRLNQNVDYANKMAPINDAKARRTIEVLQGGQTIPADVTKQLSMDDTERLRMLLQNREAQNKRQNITNMVRNILTGASLFF